MILESISKCSDSVMVPIVSVVKKVFLMIQIIGPILAIISVTILMFRLMLNPDDQQDKIKHGIRNSIISLVVLFLLPLLIDLTMALLGDTFSVSSCWNNDKNNLFGSNYINTGKQKQKIVGNDGGRDSGGNETGGNNTGGNDTGGNNTASNDMADAFVNLALSQKSDPSAKGGRKYWQYIGKKKHTAWCAAFVSWVIGNTEYNSEKMTKYFDYKTQSCGKFIKYCKSHSGSTYYQRGYTPKRGDLIFFDWDNDGYQNHIGIVQYTKNGKIKTIEGNCGDKIKERTIDVNNKKIFGFCSWY